MQVPNGLKSPELRKVFHYVDVAAGMILAAEGKVAHVVPFKHHGVRMTLYKGEAALAVRRAVASALDSSQASTPRWRVFRRRARAAAARYHWTVADRHG